MKTGFLLSFLLIIILSCAQNTASLTDDLKEISGLELYRDSIFFAINDGGNKNEIFLLSKNLQLIKKVEVKDVINNDWEALAIDDAYLYIGDIGNNSNKRKNLQIHRIPIHRILEKSKVIAETMEIEYAEQTSFPPKESQLYFDAEAMISREGKLWIFTKNRTKPFDGKSLIYSFEFIPNVKKKISKTSELVTGTKGWLMNSVTGATSTKEYLYLLSYSQINRYKWNGNSLKKIDFKSFPGYAQMEAISISSSGEIFIANEANKFLGKQKIQQLQWKR